MSKNNIIEFGDELKKVNDLLQENIKILVDVGTQIKKTYSPFPSGFAQQLKDQQALEIQAEKLRNESIKSIQRVEAERKKAIQTADRQRKQEVEDYQRRQKAFDAEEKRLQREKKRLEELNRPYIKLQATWRESQRVLQDLVASQGANAEATKKARIEFEKLDKQIRTVDSITKNYSKNVGNYASAIPASLGQLMGAFGIVGGVTTGVAVLKDAFKIVRDFDAEMVNLGAIAGKTRSELGSLEKVIRDTAKSSLNTANDVAKVATELIKLGSTIEETEKLIPTVNSLSIALRAGADETAELLKSTLNAFGDSADQAERYGDVIAGMANKSALDFGRIRDAMSYIAPVAKALGYTIEETGALIGVLVDNGIKAESAGRLLRTAMIKLQGEGLTLNQALEKIKNSSDQTTTAYKLMGAEASTLGVVLANNTEKLAEMTKELQNSKGELQELTDKQLKSLSAQINITKSNWEEFILSIENGEGELAKFASKFLQFVNQAIDGLTRLSLSWNEIWGRAQDRGFSAGTKEANEFLNTIEKSSDKQEQINRTLKNGLAEQRKLEQEISDLRKKEAEITEGGLWTTLTNKGVYWYQKEIEDKEVLLGQLKGINKRLQDENVKNALGASGLGQETTETKTPTETLSDKEILALAKAQEERLKLIFEARKTELTSEIEHARNIGLINATSEQEKLAVQLKYNEDYNRVLKLNYDEEVRLAQGNKEKLLLAEAKYNAELQKLADEQYKITEEAREKQYKDAVKLANMLEDNDAKNAMKSALLTAKTEQDKVQARLKYIEEQKKAVDRDEKEALRNVQEGSLEQLTIWEEYNQKRIELDQQANEIIADQAKKAQEKIKSYLSEFTDLGNFGFSSLNIFTTFEENGKTAFENLLDNATDWKTKIALIVTSVGEVFKDVMGAMQESSRARFENEMKQLELSYETNILFAGESKEAKEKLEQEFEEKQRELRIKQAKRDKQMAIMNAVINTAQGVVSMLATVPWPANFVMAGLVGALGAVQIATIASTPIPEFWTGTDNAPQGWAWTQERGAEVITDKHGNVKTMGNNKGPQLTWLESGDKVFKSQEDYFKSDMARMLNDNGISHNINIDPFDYGEFDRILAKNQSQTNVNMSFDEDGFNYRTDKRNKRQQKVSYNARG